MPPWEFFSNMTIKSSFLPIKLNASTWLSIYISYLYSMAGLIISNTLGIKDI